MQYMGFDLEFDVHGPDEAGTLVATCKQVPMIVAATTEEELQRRLLVSVEGLRARLRRMGPEERAEFFASTRISPRFSHDSAPPMRQIKLPVLSDAAG